MDKQPPGQPLQGGEVAVSDADQEVEEEGIRDMSAWAVAGRWAEALTTHGDFENFIMVIIAGTVVTLALDDPLLGDMEGRNLPLYWLSEWWTGAALGILVHML